MARRAAILLLAVLVAGCGGHRERTPAIDRVLAAGGHFTLDGTVKVEAGGLLHLMSAASVPVHMEGNLSAEEIEAEGVALSGERLALLRRALASASWSDVHGEPLPHRAHFELELSRRQLESLLGGDLPGRVQGAHVSANVTFRR